MNVLGTYVLGNQQYFINIVRKKTTVAYTLFSRETKDDIYRGIMGEPKQDIRIIEQSRNMQTVDMWLRSSRKRSCLVTFTPLVDEVARYSQNS